MDAEDMTRFLMISSASLLPLPKASQLDARNIIFCALPIELDIKKPRRKSAIRWFGPADQQPNSGKKIAWLILETYGS